MQPVIQERERVSTLFILKGKDREEKACGIRLLDISHCSIGMLTINGQWKEISLGIAGGGTRLHLFEFMASFGRISTCEGTLAVV
jgi:hypothetical protein